jgi:uncharacterized protein (DUF58 family)
VKLGRSLIALAIPLILGAMLRQPWMIVVSVSVAALLVAAHFWRQHALDQVHYRRRFHYTRGFPGETSDVRIEIENRKLLPVSWLKASDAWPLGVPPEGGSTLNASSIPNHGQLVNIYNLRWREKLSRAYRITFLERGVHQAGPLRLESGDLFGIFDTSKTLEVRDNLTVFPEILPLEALKLAADDPFGEQKARRPLFEDPNRPMGVRPYRPEDEFRRVHWPATARTGSLQVKVYQPVTAQALVVCLNVSTRQQIWLGTEHGLLEQLIKVSATLAYHATRDGYAVGLLSNGCLMHSDQPFRIPPNRAPGQLGLLLESLAAVTPYVTTPFDQYLLNAMPHLPYGATLVVVTAFVNPELSETLLRMKRYRAHTTLISLDAAPPPDIPNVRAIHLPYSEE